MREDFLLQPFPWSRYSRRVRRAIGHPKNFGEFSEEGAKSREMRLATGCEGSIGEENWVKLYWLVDASDGIIVDARFQVCGHTATIAAAEAACQLVVGKSYEQADRIHTDLLDRQLRDRPEEPAFPLEVIPHLSLVISAMHEAALQCFDIPLDRSKGASPPSPFSAPIDPSGEAWKQLSHPERLQQIEQLLDSEIRPYIALDAGGVEVVELTPDDQLIITYQGNCTSCYSSVGTTLSYIQQILTTHLSPTLRVTPDFDTPPTGPPPWMQTD